MNNTHRSIHGTLVVVAAFLALFILFSFRSTFAILKDPMLTELGWTNAQTTLGYGIMMTVYAVSAFACGLILDKWGTRPVLVIAAVLGCLGFTITSHCSQMYAYCLAYGLFGGVATGMLFVSSTISVRKWYVGKDYATMFGIAHAGAPLAQVVLAWFLKEALSHGVTWRVVMQRLGMLTLVGLLVAALLSRRGPEAYGLRPKGALAADDQNSGDTYAWTLREAFARYAIWGTILAFLTSVLAEFLVWTQVVSYWRTDLGMDIGAASSMYMIIGATGVVSMLVMGYMADRVVRRIGHEPTGRKRMLQVGPVIAAVGCVLLLLQHHALWLGGVFCVLFAIYWSIVPGGMVGYAGSLYGRQTLGKIWGLATMVVMAVGPFAGALIGGYLKDITGTYTASLQVALCSFLLSFLLATSLPLSLRAPEQVARERDCGAILS